MEPEMGYDIIEDIKKTKENVSLFEMSNLPQQKKKLLEALDPQPSKTLDNVPLDKEINEASIGGNFKSRTKPFLLTFEIFNLNVHNCLVYSGASSNVIPLSVCKNINGKPTPSSIQIIQLDRTEIKVASEMKNVLIRLAPG